MNFFEYITQRTNTCRYEVVVVTQTVLRMNILGQLVPVKVQHTELRKPETSDVKSLFVQTLRVKLSLAISELVSTWEGFLGWLKRWKATQGTITIARSLWKEYTRALRNLRIRDNGYCAST